MKKLIAFDLDGTLAPSKSTIPDRIAEALNLILDNYQVCIITGGKYEIIQQQVLSHLKVEPSKMQKVHIMPTCGTRYYGFDISSHDWVMHYAEDFTGQQKSQIIEALNAAVSEFKLNEAKTYGDIIEDRESQITLSTLGQDVVAELGEEGVKLKENWDPTGARKNEIRKYVADLIPEFEVRAAGATSIDVTKPGLDKAYGMQKLIDMLDISQDEILFFGDKMREGGNDFPVKAMGIDSIEVSGWQDTAMALEAIIAVSR